MRYWRINWATVFSVGELACFFAAWLITLWTATSEPRGVDEAVVTTLPATTRELSLAAPRTY
jgi:hypothetical protein